MRAVVFCSAVMLPLATLALGTALTPGCTLTTDLGGPLDAIHDQALTLDRILAHYRAGKP